MVLSVELFSGVNTFERILVFSVLLCGELRVD